MISIGGAELYIHKYLGPKNPADGESTADQPQYGSLSESNIQDLLFLENRDRVYDSSIYKIKGVYNVADIDFNLSQFGLFIDNDTLYITVHINNFINTVGRKPLSGDVIEIPNLRDEFALNTFDVSLPRYYVISDVGRAAEGFSPTWYPHLYRLRLTKVSDSQQYSNIFVKPADSDENFVGDYNPTKTYQLGDIVRYQGQLYTTTQESTGNVPTNTAYFSAYGGDTLRDLLSNANKSLEINDMLIAQAEADAPKSGYETQHLYTLVNDDSGSRIETAAVSARTSKRPGYTGYLLGDGVPDNGVVFGHGITFPNNPLDGDYFLRTDFLPNRLFRYDGSRWVKREDNVRTSMTPSATRNTQKGTFINNTNRTGVDIIKSDIVRLESSIILTEVEYTDRLYAEGSIAEVGVRTARTITNVNGKAAIAFAEPEFSVGDLVEYKLFASSIEECVALSKAVKIKPLSDI